jgi:KaiC/GvpD/RAD55 family RecA-like ATPase
MLDKPHFTDSENQVLSVYKKSSEELQKLLIDAAKMRNTISTGLKWFSDDTMEFVLLGGGITIIASPSGGGKSVTLYNLAALQMKQGRSVLYIGAEETLPEVLEAITVLYKGYTDKPLSTRQFQERLIMSSSELSGVQELLEVHDVTGEKDTPQIDQISISVRKKVAKMKDKPILFIDYAQILHPAEKDNRKIGYERTKAVCDGMRKLRSEGFTIVTAAQVNRLKEARSFWTVEKENLREAGDLEQMADCVIYALCDKLNRTFNFRVLKGRKGVNTPEEGDCCVSAYSVNWKYGGLFEVDNCLFPTLQDIEEKTITGKKSFKRERGLSNEPF